MKIDLRYVVEDIDRHGNARLYVAKRGCRKVRLKEVPGTAAFLAEYRAAREAIDNAAKPKSGTAEPETGTLRWLGAQYSKSRAFRALDPRSQRVRLGILESCFAEPLKPGSPDTFGSCPIDKLTQKHIKVLRERKDAKPGAANNRIRTLRVVFDWALEKEIKGLLFNPARDVKSVKYAKEPFHTWTVEEVAQFEARHPVGSRARLALSLMLYLGVRRSDVVVLGRQHVKGNQITFTPVKTRASGKSLTLTILPVLANIIEASPTGDLTFLVTDQTKPVGFTAAGFGGWFRERCDEAGLPQCTAHGLRKAGAVMAAENGATEKQLMAIFGWESAKLAAHYTKMADQKRLAADAMHLLEEQSGHKPAPTPKNTTTPTAKKAM